MLVQNPSDIIIERPDEENYETIKENTLNGSNIKQYLSSRSPSRPIISNQAERNPSNYKNSSVISNVSLPSNKEQKTSQLLLLNDKKNTDAICSSIISNQNSQANNSKEMLEQNRIATDPKVVQNINIVKLQISEGSNMKYREVCNYFLSEYLNRDKEVNVYVNENKEKVCCLYRLFGMHKTYEIDKELVEERNYVIYSNEVKFNIEIDIHFKVLKKIYLALCTIENEKAKTKVTDVNEKIINNFIKESMNVKLKEENKDKFTIDQITMYGLIQIIGLIDKHPTFFEKTYHFYTFESKNYLFFILLNLTMMTIQQVKNGKMNIYLNKNKNVVKTLNAFYYGLIEICNNELENSPTNAEANRLEFILLTAQKAASENLSSVLWKYNCFKEKYIESKDSANSSFTYNGV